MPVFTPPTVLDLSSVSENPDEIARNPIGYALMRHYGPKGPRGRTVLKESGVYTTVDLPEADRIAAADAVYLGGHIYDVDATEAAALTAAGYGAYLS